MEDLSHEIKDFQTLARKFKHASIVFVWSQYDGGNIDKEQLAKVPSKTKDAKLIIMGGDFI